MDAKTALRRRLLADRAQLSNEQLTANAVAVLEILRTLLLEYAPSTVAAYVPFGSEPGGPELPELAASLTGTLLVPVLLPDKDLDWAAYPRKETLGRQALSAAEVIIVPALAVDLTGVRLGRGGGSYDRALTRASSSALLVALLHSGEILARVPTQPHDRKVHRVITPDGITKLDR